MLVLPRLSRRLRIALVVSLAASYAAWHGHHQIARAGSGDEPDDDSASDDNAGKGDDDSESEDEDEDAKDQPPVTAGGLFTLQSYPVRELFRPLTMTQRIVQLRAGLGTDVSAKGAFESAGVSLEAIYGARDNVSVIGGFTSAYNMNQFGVYAGLEAALAYDLVDFRTALRLSRDAAAEAMSGLASDQDAICDATAMADMVAINPGKYAACGTKASIDIGFPFRYVAMPEVAIVALNTLMTIDLDGSKPDLVPSVGLATNPIAAVSLVLFAQLRIRDFDTDAAHFTVPATARIEFSPSQKLDLGLEFTFLNMKPPEGTNFYDNRFLTLYMQSRFGG